MRQVQDDESPERAVYKSTLVRSPMASLGRIILVPVGVILSYFFLSGPHQRATLHASRPERFFLALCFPLQAFFRALNRKYKTWPYIDPAGGVQCTGHWTVVHPCGGKPFVGCSGWRPGHPSTRCGDHLGAQFSAQDSPAVLEELRVSGPRPKAGADA